MNVNIELLAEQANALAKHCSSHVGEPWYEGLMNMLCEIEYQLSREGEAMLIATEEE